MRRTLGTAVFGGMLGVTLFGIFLTPVFYYLVAKATGSPWAKSRHETQTFVEKKTPGS
jgi:multidrug efflux pump